MITITNIGGNDWNVSSAAPISEPWIDIASDSTGMNLAAVQYPGHIYISTSGILIVLLLVL